MTIREQAAVPDGKGAASSFVATGEGPGGPPPATVQGARRARDMSVEDLARAADVGRDAVVALEAGDPVDDAVRRSVRAVLDIPDERDVILPVPRSPVHAGLIAMVHKLARERGGFAVFPDPDVARPADAGTEGIGAEPEQVEDRLGGRAEEQTKVLRSLVLSLTGTLVSAGALLALYAPLVRLSALDGGHAVASVVAAAGGMACAMCCFATTRDAKALRAAMGRAASGRSAAAPAPADGARADDTLSHGYALSDGGLEVVRADGRTSTDRRWVPVDAIYAVTVRALGHAHVDVEVSSAKGVVVMRGVPSSKRLLATLRGWAAPVEGAPWRTVVTFEPTP